MPGAGTASVEIADAYWASHFGCALEGFLQPGIRVQQHGGELTGYHGVFALFHGPSVCISLPPGLSASFRDSLAGLSPSVQPADVAAVLEPVAARIIGPAFIGYTDTVDATACTARMITPADAVSVTCLQEACDSEEWEHGGSDPAHEACAGVFVAGELAALAGFETWGGIIAHISVVTHPRHRGRGHGRDVVACIAAHAARAGLLPQYRTLCANQSSMRIARSLGFKPYAVSLAVRLHPEVVPFTPTP